MGGASAWGIRSLADTFLSYFQPGLPAYLRRQTIENTANDYSALGFQPTVSGGLSGFYDTLIDPPADVREVSMHNIGVLGGRLNFGAKVFVISDTFVTTQMDLLEFTDPYQVWRDPLVMGVYYNSRLFSIESITQEAVGGKATLWKIICNSNEFVSPRS